MNGTQQGAIREIAADDAARQVVNPVPGSALVSLSSVSKDYKKGKHDVSVLRGLNLTVERSEFVAVMGASGSGKSTFLNLVGGIDRPSAGSINIANLDITRMSQSKLAQWRGRNIGFVFQFYNLIGSLSAWNNIALPLMLQGLGKADVTHRVNSVVELLGIEDRVKHRPNELSGGQQQRVAIARALVTNAGLLLCDEPTGDLDRENAERIMGILKMLKEEHSKTIIMATHDPQSARYADRIINFDKPGF